MKPIFVIEHLEPQVWKWCAYEYEHISQTVGKENLWFTNVRRDGAALFKYGKVFRQSVRELNLQNICVLDPQAEKTLSPDETNKFDFFIFGGILGDYPPKKRTKKELTRFLPDAEKRNIGKRQLATDNAVYVVHEIVGGKKFEDLKFKQGATIRINEIESTDLPFRYALVDGKPFISEKVVNYLKRKKGF
jgi:ribosome biogenesis SPOUT family RNA methylase Rps3